MLIINKKQVGRRRTYASVKLSAITHNVSECVSIKSDNIKHIFAVVKANGYGHGAPEVARAALKGGATALAVATLDEAESLRNEGFTESLLVMGNVETDDLQFSADNDISVTIHTEEIAKEASKIKGLKVHVKVNSGMSRLGFKDNETFTRVVEMLSKSEVELEGVFTHFAVADSGLGNDDYLRQLSNFETITKEVDLSQFKIVHMSNSASHTMQDPIATQNGIRLGIIIYGLKPDRDMDVKINQKQAMSLYSYVTQITPLKKGEKVGYGMEFVADKDMLIASAAIGYADGYIRKNKVSDVAINGQRHKVRGRVCMDQMMFEVDSSVKVGDQVEMFGPTITIDETAKNCETINYEVTCIITARVPRVYE